MVSCTTTSVSIASLGSYFYLNESLSTCVSAETCPAYGAKTDLLNNLRDGTIITLPILVNFETSS